MNPRRGFFVVLFTVLSFHSLRTNAQTYFSNPFVFSAPEFDFGISAESYFNFNDIFVGFGLGTDDVNNDWGASVNVDFRPYFKKVRVEENDNLFYQYREKLFFLSLDLTKKFYFLKFNNNDGQLGVYVEGRFGYLFGNYRGVSKSPNDKFMIAPAAGFTYDIDFIGFYLGYLNFNSGSDASNHMINLGMHVHF